MAGDACRNWGAIVLATTKPYRLIPDKSQAMQFLSLLSPCASDFTFQCFDDKDRDSGFSPKVLNGSLDQHWAELVRRNLAGQGIYVTISQTDGLGRKKANIKAARAIWQEDDNGHAGEGLPIPPSITVESSLARYHRYWVLVEPDADAVEEVEAVENRLAADYGSDPNATDVSRVLRLPGFFNMKAKYGEPFMVRITSDDINARYTWDQITAAFPPLMRTDNPSVTTSTAGAVRKPSDLTMALMGINEKTIAELRSALTAINADDRADWVAVGHALKTLGERGRRLWKDWSQTSKKYDPVDAAEKWKSFNPGRTGYEAVFSKAQRNGWVNPRKSLETSSLQAVFPKTQAAHDNKDALAWTDSFVLSDAEIDAIADPDWLIPNVVIQGHVVALVAEPNGGKTTIALHLAGEMAGQGHKVFYVNADTSGGDAKPMHKLASQNGFTLMLPDMIAGSGGMSDVVKHLQAMNQASCSYAGTVFIFDTLKKMTDVINKNLAKALYKLLRSLSTKGMTSILLAHTNKYNGEDGMPVYEGTGDLRSDIDELIYLIPEKNPDGSMVVTTEPDKKRGDFEKITFKIDKDRNVTLLDDVVDTAKLREYQEKIKRDQAYIDAVNEAINNGSTSQKQIIDYCKQVCGIGAHTIRRVLTAFSVDEPSITSLLSNEQTGMGLWVRRNTGKTNQLEYRKMLFEEPQDERNEEMQET